MSEDWPLYEVFIRSRSGLEHKHVGSLHAADARMAIEHARDLYTRRQEGVSIDRKSTRLNSSHVSISYAVFCLKKKTNRQVDRVYIDELLHSKRDCWISLTEF